MKNVYFVTLASSKKSGMSRILKFIVSIAICLCCQALSHAEMYEGYMRISNNSGLSNSSVTVIFQDSEDVMWFGTWNGLNRYDGASIRQYRPQPRTENSISHQVIRSVSEDRDGYLWIATDYGINRMDRKRETFSKYYLGYGRPYVYEERLFSCCVSSDGVVAAALKGGKVCLYDRSSDSFNPVRGYDGNVASVLFFDTRQNLWVLTETGTLVRLSLKDGQAGASGSVDVSGISGIPLFDGKDSVWFQKGSSIYNIGISGDSFPVSRTHVVMRSSLNAVANVSGKIFAGTSDGCYEISADGKKSLLGKDFPVLSVFSGSQGIFWIGTDGNGVLKELKRPEFITSFRAPGSEHFPVRAIYCDNDGNILTGSKGGGLHVILDNGEHRHFHAGPGRTSNSVFAIEPADGRVWVGTDGSGLKYLDRGGTSLNSLDMSGFPEGNMLSSVYAIERSGKDTLYIGTSGNGLFRIILDGGTRVRDIVNYRHIDGDSTSIGSNIIYDMVDDGEVLWLATRGGGLNMFEKSTGRVRIFREDGCLSKSVCSNDVISLLQDSSGRLWAGTTSGLSMMSRSSAGEYEFRHFDENSGLPNTNIHAILEGNDSTIWVSTDKGIAKISPRNSFAVSSWSYDDGLSDNEYSDGACFAQDGGSLLYFGSVEGVDVINPSLVPSATYIPKLQLYHVSIDNEPYYPSSNEIVTDYRTGSLAMTFSLPEYAPGQKSSLAYVLYKGKGKSPEEISEQAWLNIGESRQIILNRLSPGKYAVYVKAVNQGEPCGVPQSWRISVSWPKLFNPWLAVIYLMLIVAVATVLYLLHRSRKMIFEELEKQKWENAFKEEITQAKLRFFTNIAHEFSNSITLIFGAVEQIFSLGISDSGIRKQLIAIRSNADRMHRQISELMEFSKADSGHLPVMYEKVDVNELIKYTFDNFLDVADAKKIHLSFHIQDSLPGWVTDRSMLEKIVFNLISNSMKYTPSDGWIQISARQGESGNLEISVSNSGPGIRPENISKIFDRYVILDNFETKLSSGHYTRTGIGLALCKDLAELLGGTIAVRSNVDEFTDFTVSLPWKDEGDIYEPEAVADEQGAGVSPVKGQTVMVIDDFAGIRELISDILSDEYSVVKAADAESALAILKETRPALIICDMVMPGMGGIQFVKNIKADEATRSIPVLMLSCDSDIDNRVNAINTGAEMFIVKPFHPRYLKAVVERMLGRDGASSAGSLLEDTIEKVEGKYHVRDNTFKDKVMDALSRNFSDETYNQDALAYDMAMSRVQLYRKIKHDLGTTPGELIRRYRIRQAEILLRETDKTVQEIMYDCGFHNKAYFYREFSRLHNCSPKDFRQQNASQPE